MKNLEMDTSLTIVICSKDRAEDLSRCLASIRSQPSQPDRIVILDQSETKYDLGDDRLIDHLYMPNLTGLAQARNVAMLHVRSGLTLFLDDDVELMSDCVRAVREAFARHADAIGIACKIRYPPPYSRAHTLRMRIYVAIFEHGFFKSASRARREGVEMRTAEGCGMAFRSELFEFEKVDEHLVGYSFGEDWEFSLRARRHGKIWLAEDAVVMHHKSPANRWSSQRLLRGRWTNFLYFYDKHRAGGSIMNRFWRRWWMLGEALRWAWLGMGFPILGARDSALKGAEQRYVKGAVKARTGAAD